MAIEKIILISLTKHRIVTLIILLQLHLYILFLFSLERTQQRYQSTPITRSISVVMGLGLGSSPVLVLAVLCALLLGFIIIIYISTVYYLLYKVQI